MNCRGLDFGNKDNQPLPLLAASIVATDKVINSGPEKTNLSITIVPGFYWILVVAFLVIFFTYV